MIRRVVLLVGLAIFVATLAPAADEPAIPGDEPPLRLKKKKKADAPPPAAEEKKQEEKKPEEKKEQAKEEMPGEITRDGEPIDPGEDEKEVLNRVARNMKSVEERIVNKELNEGTRQLQEDIVKDLESLIRNSESPQGGGGGGGGNEANEGGGQNDPQNQQGQKGQKGGQKSGQQGQKSGQQGQKSGQKANQQGQKGQQGGQQGQKGNQQKNQQGQKGGQQKNQQGDQGNDNKGGKQEGQQEKESGKGNGNPGAGNGQEMPPLPNREGEVYKDPWGHLPETLRQQMNAYSSREKYMEKHHDLIKQYYKTIAAQGRKKEN